jgi:hypothetical protein
MSDLWPLLTGEPLNGDTVIHRQLRPAGCAVPVDRTDLESAAHAVIGLCNSWGGSAMPLIPVTPHAPIDSRCRRILLQSSIDGIAKTDLLDEEERAKYRDIHGGDYRQLLLRILVDLDIPSRQCRHVAVCPPTTSGTPRMLSAIRRFARQSGPNELVERAAARTV